jgi:hypothetical protein
MIPRSSAARSAPATAPCGAPATAASGPRATAGAIAGRPVRSSALAIPLLGLVALLWPARLHAQDQPAAPMQPSGDAVPTLDQQVAAEKKKTTPPPAEPNAAPPPAPMPPPPPATEVKPSPAATEAKPAAPPAAEQLHKDEVAEPGYLPGYRMVPQLGMSPWSPAVATMPGGVMPAYGAPTPLHDWTFEIHGYLSASGQFGINHRVDPGPGQSTTVIHALPQTIEEYASFLSTNTQPGQWVAFNTIFGNHDVTAHISLTTWNPSDPTTFYQIGTQYFINDAFLSYNMTPASNLRMRANVGYFYNNYGTLGGSGSFGMYQNAMSGGPRGVGENVSAEYPLTPTVSLLLEEGLMGNRNGHAPTGTAPAGANSNVDPLFPGSYIAHIHAGFVRSTDVVIRGQLHFLYNFAQDDRPQFPAGALDNQVTRAINETDIPDASIALYSADLSVTHPIYGHLGVAATHIKGDNAFGLRGLFTFGNEGQQLTERWFGVNTGGTGTLDVAAFDYSASLGKILSQPIPFDANGPDVILSLGGVVATSHSADSLYDGRIRQKYGADVLYRFVSFLSAGLRVDHVSPNSKDTNENYDVVAARLVFKTDWQSRENITLLYAKWFYGTDTHAEYSSVGVPRLDDQLISLNVNMWF